MSATDVYIQAWLFSYGFPLFYITVFTLLVAKYWSHIHNRLYASFVQRSDKAYDELTKNIKISLFSSLHHTVSANWKLRNEGLIRILELGVRTGQNLKYYPKNSHIIAVDSNAHLEEYFTASYKIINTLTLEKCISSNGENLADIPDCSIDAVIATLFLCSTVNVDQVLKEIQRVLVHGGKYYFLEHVHEQQHQCLRSIQSFLSVTRIWPYAFGGCHLNRNIEFNIKQAEFMTVDCKCFELHIEGIFPLKFVNMHVVGIATK